MTKKEFMETLKEALSELSPEEIEDILEDYREHFAFGLSEGKNEQQIAAELGNPYEIAFNYGATSKNKKAENFSSDSTHQKTFDSRSQSTSIQIAKIIFLVLLGIIVVPTALGLGIGLIGIFIGALATLLSGIFVALFEWNFSGFSVLPLSIATKFFLFLGLTGLALLMMIGCFYGFKAISVALKKYFKWNASFMRGE